MTAPDAVDVLSVLVKLASFGGTIGPCEVLPQFNTPRPTRTIRSHLRAASASQVRAALRRAEKAGDIECVANPAPGWNSSAADRAELYWRLTPAALERCGGAR
ncbi:hypothetical protein [Xanthomonas sacchari]|uniref:hypothetical protein n=1 Tax=Xanthomonas sacchari TaxID=56458 RepID=UPI002258B7FC|nr:hypothetical protein [Xanthomonas sacchari]MCW0370241.1 hypothetical protein [Xanthomonas sacchari]